MNLTYRELQAKLKLYRDEHGVKLTCKLNESKEVLEDELASIRSSLFETEIKTDATATDEDEVLAVDIDALSQVSEMLVKEDFPIVLATSNLLMVDIGADKPTKLCRYHDKILLVTPTGVESEHLDLDEVMKTMRQLKTETEIKNENDSRLEYQVSKLDAYIQTEVEMQIANINYVTIDLDRIGYWIKCSWHVVDFTKYPKISLKTEVIKGNDTLLNEKEVSLSILINQLTVTRESENDSQFISLVKEMLTLEQFKNECLNQEEYLKNEDWEFLVDVLEVKDCFWWLSPTNEIKYSTADELWTVRGRAKGMFEYEYHSADNLEDALKAKEERYEYVYPYS